MLGAGSWLKNSGVSSAPSTKQYNDFGKPVRIYLDQDLARQQPKIEYRQMQKELGWFNADTLLTYVSTTTMQRTLEEIEVQKFRAKR